MHMMFKLKLIYRENLNTTSEPLFAVGEVLLNHAVQLVG